MIKLTQAQIDKTRKDLALEIRDINRLKISDEEKISLIGELSEGYKKGFETCAGTTFDTRDVDIILGIEKGLAKFSERVGQVEPGVKAKEDIERISKSVVDEICKIARAIICFFWPPKCKDVVCG